MGGQGSTARSFICTVDLRRVSWKVEVEISLTKVKMSGGQSPRAAQGKRWTSLVNVLEKKSYSSITVLQMKKKSRNGKGR